MRQCYIVAVEVTSDEVRQKVRERLKTLGGYCPILKDCWAVTTEQSAAAIRDSLKQDLDSGDRVFVVRSGTEAAWRNSYGPKNSEWLKKYL
jgi:uroporphyrinogen-III synthase